MMRIARAVMPSARPRARATCRGRRAGRRSTRRPSGAATATAIGLTSCPAPGPPRAYQAEHRQKSDPEADGAEAAAEQRVEGIEKVQQQQALGGVNVSEWPEAVGHQQQLLGADTLIEKVREAAARAIEIHEAHREGDGQDSQEQGGFEDQPEVAEVSGGFTPPHPGGPRGWRVRGAGRWYHCPPRFTGEPVHVLYTLLP